MSSGVGVWSCGLKFVWSCDQTLLFTRRRTFSLKRHEGSSRFFHKTSWCYRTTRCMSSVEKNEKKKKEKVIVISGPTGAGKSRLALELAKRLNGEIISADSVQVYRGLDIGSAKPLPCDRKEVPHHLLDILHPSEDYSVGQFFEDARQATRNIFDNGHVPIIAGGTGLYLRWYIYGKPEVPKASLEIAAEVDSEFMLLQKNGDWDAGVQLLVKAGDSRAHDLASNDWYRLRRSLEIIKSTGSPPSAFHVPYDSYKEQLDSRISKPSSDDVSSADVSSADGLGQNPYKDLEYEYICFFLSIKRMDLYRLIDLRCEEMLLGDESILLEASSLLEMGLLPNTNSATRAIGYRQAMEYLLKCRQGGGCSPGEFYAFLSEFQKASRNFAKRQMTWFRNEKIYHWLDASQPLESVLNCILDFYHDENGTAVVPKQLRMKKDMNSRKEIYEMKSYRTKNRHFVGREDCYHILDRIRTQQ